MLNLYKSSCVLRSGRSFSISGSLAVDEVPVEVGLPVEVTLNRTKFCDGKNRSKFVKIGRIWPKSEKFGEIRFFVRIVERAELRFEPKTVKPRPQIEVLKSIVILAYVFSNKQRTVFIYNLYKMVTTLMNQQFCSVVSNK
jgi:hypothetical protein